MDDSCICQQFAAANDSFAGRDELTITFIQFEDHSVGDNHNLPGDLPTLRPQMAHSGNDRLPLSPL